MCYAKEKYPRFFAITDNMALDIRILDNILVYHGYHPLSYRSETLYLQAICTWSYRLGFLKSYNINSIDLRALLDIEPLSGIRHTPLYDAITTVREFIALKNFIMMKKKRAKFTRIPKY